MGDFRAEAHIIDLTAPAGGVVAGSVYLIGSLLVVANVSADAGDTFAAVRYGLYDNMAKATGSAWTEGAKLYWDDTNKRFTTTATANTLAGVAAAAATAGATSGSVLLTGVIA